MSDLGALVVSLTMQSAQFHSEMHRSAAAMNTTMGQMAGSVKQVENAVGQIDGQLAAFGTSVRTIIGTLAVGAIGGMIAQTISAAGRMADLALITGITADELAGMREAAATGGASIDQVAHASVRLSKNLETAGEAGGDVANVLRAMGISMEEIKAKSPAEQLHLIAQRMNQFADGSGKAAAAQILLGKAGTELLPFLKDYGAQTEIAVKGHQAFTDAADRLGDQLALLKLKQEKIVEGIANDLLPALNAITKAFVDAGSEAKGSESIWTGLGEIFRYLALGARTIGTAFGLVAGDLAALAASVSVIATGTVGEMGLMRQQLDEIWTDRGKKIDEGTQALFRFYDSVKDGSKWMGESAKQTNLSNQALLKAHDAYYQAKVELKGLTDEQPKAADAVKRFLDKLKEQLVTMGLSKEETLRYQAAQIGATKTAEPLIRAIEAKTEKLKLEDDLIKQAIDEHKAYTDWQKKVRDETEKAVQTWKDENDALEMQIATMGMTKAEIDRVTAAKQREQDRTRALMIDDESLRTGQLRAIDQVYRHRLDLINSKELRDAERAAAEDSRKIWEDAATGIERALEDALLSGMTSGKNLGQALRNELERMFRTLVLRPMLQPIANMAASGMQGIMSMFSGMTGGSGGAAGGDSSGLFGNLASSLFSSSGGFGGMMASGAASLFGSSALGATGLTGVFNAFATSGIGSALGLSTTAGGMALTAGGGGAMLTTLGSSIAAAIPVIGWVVAAVAMISSMFSETGGPKVGAWSTMSFTDGMSNADLQANSPSGGGDLRSTIGVINTIQSGYMAALQGLGGTAMAGYRISVGYETDPEGESRPYGIITINPDDAANNARRYEDQRHLYDSGKFDPNSENFQLYASQAIIAALAASELPDYLADIFDAALPNNFSVENVNDLLKFGAALKTVHDLIGRDLTTDVADAVAASRRTAMESYFAQGEALRELMANFDGSAAAAENLAQATTQYYAAQVQLLAQIESLRTSLTGEFGSWEQLRHQFQYNLLDNDHERRAFHEADMQSYLDRLRASSDPTQVQFFSEALLQNVQTMWQFWTTDERRSASGEGGLIDEIMRLTNERLAAAEQRIREDPNAPQNIMRSAADLIHQAGLDFVTAANASNAAAYAMRTAAETQEVDVNIHVYDGRIDTEVGGGGGE